MDEDQKGPIKSGESRAFSTKSVYFKNKGTEPTNILIETAGGDSIDILLTTGSEFRFIAAGDSSVSILGQGENAVVDPGDADKH
ncbi:hypothetical protein [Alcaligenes faecalis]|uniref:hypothetical protein n=1 Tax=Alcaligenes faecalis TaxID=511 RepID=UPI0007C59A20|nr:hypothetical protein [Alcaligenes faecalis]